MNRGVRVKDQDSRPNPSQNFAQSLSQIQIAQLRIKNLDNTHMLICREAVGAFKNL